MIGKKLIMKTKLILAFVAITSMANAQWINSLSVQLEGGVNYDTYNPSKDNNIIDVPITDMRSYLSEMDGMNPTANIGVNYAFNSLFSWTAGFGYGAISGSNVSDYYTANLMVYDFGVRFHSSNLNPETAGSKWRFTPQAKLIYADFTSELYFKSDGSLQRITDDASLGSAFGAELSYNLDENWSIHATGLYNTVFNDGLDGWDYGSGTDNFVRASFGVRYRFTAKKDDEVVLNKADLNYFSPEVLSHAPAFKEMAKGDKEAMTETVTALKEEVKTAVEAERKLAEENNAKVEEALTMLREADNALFEASHKTAVFFNSESARLTLETKQELFRFAQSIQSDDWDGNYKVIVRGFSDKYGAADYNQDLRDKRAEAVANFIQEALGIDASVEIATDEHEKIDEHRLDRRVELSVEVAE
jgi:outer membrane protein OmpA-like peptidoglycan-associated protein